MKFLSSGLFSLVLLLTAPQLRADEVEKSKQLILDSKRCLAAFECHHFALIAKDQELATKLFLVGYESGRRFLEGADKGKLLPDDRKEIGIVFGFVAGGPSHDFVLGRLFEKMKEDLDVVLKENPIETWQSVGEHELRKRNAALIVEGFKPDPSLGEEKDEAWKRYLEYLRKLKQGNDAKDGKTKPAEVPRR